MIFRGHQQTSARSRSPIRHEDNGDPLLPPLLIKAATRQK
jgi:hypothetical protein